MDDNSRNPKEKEEAGEQLVKLLVVVQQTKEKFKSKEIVKVLVGKSNALISSHRTDEKPFFGIGNEKEKGYWMALIRQSLVAGFLKKEIEQYGILKLTDHGKSYLDSPVSFLMTKDHIYNAANDQAIVSAAKAAAGVADEVLYKLLKSITVSQSKKLGVPPYVIFQEPSLQDMALKYPLSHGELVNIHGVGEGKAKKYGAPFIEAINQYVTDNDIHRPQDLVVKSTGANSVLKLYVIQNIDRKLPLDDIAQAKGLTTNDLIKEMEQIVFSGTKLNLGYWVDEILDEDQQEELQDYFLQSDSDDIETASAAFDGDYEEEELRLYRIKFISEVAN